jgi:hypothetical protein
LPNSFATRWRWAFFARRQPDVPATANGIELMANRRPIRLAARVAERSAPTATTPLPLATRRSEAPTCVPERSRSPYSYPSKPRLGPSAYSRVKRTQRTGTRTVIAGRMARELGKSSSTPENGGADTTTLHLVREPLPVTLVATFGLLDRTAQCNLCNLLRSDTRMSPTSR